LSMDDSERRMMDECAMPAPRGGSARRGAAGSGSS